MRTGQINEKGNEHVGLTMVEFAEDSGSLALCLGDICGGHTGE